METFWKPLFWAYTPFLKTTIIILAKLQNHKQQPEKGFNESILGNKPT